MKIGFILNLLGVMGLIVLIDGLVNYFRIQKNLKYLNGLGIKESKKNTKNYFFSNRLYSKINKKLYFKKNGDTSKTNFYFTIVLLIIIALFALFYTTGKPILYIGIPFITVLFINKYLDITTLDIDDKIQEQLPDVISNINKNFSRYNNLQTVIYNTTLEMGFPLKSEFQKLISAMISDDEEKALLEFADRVDNMWIYSLVFILTSYKKESTKEDVIINLRLLANIIEKENRLKEVAITDRKMSVVNNTALVIVAIIGLIVNLLFNPEAKSYFFDSTKGIVVFIVGYALVLCTFLINAFIRTRKAK